MDTDLTKKCTGYYHLETRKKEEINMKISFEIWPNAPFEGMEIVGVPVNSWGDKSVEWCMKKVAEYGYDGIDFIFDKFLELDDKQYSATVEAVPALARSLGLTVSSVGAHHLCITPKRWKVEGAMALMKKAIELASAIGAPTVASYIAGYYHPPTYMVMRRCEAMDLFVKLVRELCLYAADRGVTFSIEPHEGSLINTPDVTLELMERIGMENLFVTLDFGGVEIGMRSHFSIEEIINKFGNKINHVHAKDVSGTVGNWNMCWFGAGVVNFKRYADALRRIGYNGYICVEWEGWFRGGNEGVGETYGTGLADFDRVAVEAKEFLTKYF